MDRNNYDANVWKGRRLRILAADHQWELQRRLHEAIERQAYRLFKSQGASTGHDSQNWKQAESEVIRPLECGLITQNDKISICTDIAVFAAGDVEVYVEPRRLILCGCSGRSQTCAVRPQPDFSCRVLDLSVEVEPNHVQARLNGRILEIDLYRTPLLAQAA